VQVAPSRQRVEIVVVKRTDTTLVIISEGASNVLEVTVYYLNMNKPLSPFITVTQTQLSSYQYECSYYWTRKIACIKLEVLHWVFHPFRTFLDRSYNKMNCCLLFTLLILHV
jgi:hypothetical protein